MDTIGFLVTLLVIGIPLAMFFALRGTKGPARQARQDAPAPPAHRPGIDFGMAREAPGAPAAPSADQAASSTASASGAAAAAAGGAFILAAGAARHHAEATGDESHPGDREGGDGGSQADSDIGSADAGGSGGTP